jgi:hypothetical protein
MLCNGGQQFAVRIGCDRRFATSQPAPAQRALDSVSGLVRRVNGGLEFDLHDSSFRQRATGSDLNSSEHTSAVDY